MNVAILEEAAEDLESGAQFYESCMTGISDYFLDSILSDVDSLVSLRMNSSSSFNSSGCCRRDPHSVSVMR